MSHDTTREIQRHGMAARYSEAAVFNGVVYLAGMVPECEATDIRSQTADVLAQVEQRLKDAGSDEAAIQRCLDEMEQAQTRSIDFRSVMES